VQIWLDSLGSRRSCVLSQATNGSPWIGAVKLDFRSAARKNVPGFWIKFFDCGRIRIEGAERMFYIQGAV
jgi:hypothetical protein